MFSFSVSCKNVGVMVYKLKSFSYKSFTAFFHLWGNGGPDWKRDYALWLDEQAAEWTTIGAKSRLNAKLSYAEVARSNPIKKCPAIQRLIYPDNHFDNYCDLEERFLSKPIYVPKANPVSSPIQSSNPGRVLRWVPMGRILKPPQLSWEAIKENSNSNGPPATTRALVFSRPRTKGYNSSRPNHYFNCMGLGNFWKECTQTVRCK
jgi:hypothetical protein